MLNREKYTNELLDILINNGSLAVVNGKPVCCSYTTCSKCDFGDNDCDIATKKWANSEYIEPPVDWSKVAVDTPILVRDNENNEWRKRYFAEYKDKLVYAWAEGSTSWSTEEDMCYWKYAKLAEE